MSFGKTFRFFALTTSLVWTGLLYQHLALTEIHREPQSKGKSEMVIYYNKIHNNVSEEWGGFSANTFYDTNNDGTLDSCKQSFAMKFKGEVIYNTTNINKRSELFEKVNQYYKEFMEHQ
jgi:hypothetical protein